tara:strand:+ start:113 stop:301 length:189 start_codon:yes stop_codon:yes gene_type:complete
MTDEKEIIDEILYMVDSEPHDQTLGSKIRSFINGLPERQTTTDNSDDELLNLLNNHNYGERY